jgi:hypothetical protein
MKKADGKTFSEIGNTLRISASAASRNFGELERQGDSPDFYARPKVSGRPRVITPQTERRACRLIATGACHHATDVQRKLFPQQNPTTARRMFIRKGLHDRVRRKKPWLSQKHISRRFSWAS